MITNADQCVGMIKHLLIVSVVTLVIGSSLDAGESSPSFEKEVLPILSEHCFDCHGPDENQRKSGLRLDTLEAAVAVAKSGLSAIVPGRPRESELLARIKSEDPDDVMPPRKHGEPLDESQIAVLEAWIAAGAKYTLHWAYRPIQKPPVPVITTVGHSQNPIDAFVLAQLGDKGVKASPSANRYELIKRLYYDLLGLLPRPDEVNAFVHDERPDAYERLVERLLKSEHFGERWGRHWLDKARYADSDGYEKDNPRPHAWKYRDWVIRAINDDLPFDQFTIQQLAGDLLPEGTDEQFLATAFHRQTLTNTEGGTNREQWRVAAVMDRTETTGSVWLGLTVGCARCHTHKYDPITHREYYQLYSFFNNGDETTRKMPKSLAALREYEQSKPGYDAEWAALSEAIKERKEMLSSGQVDWEKTLKDSLEAGKAEGVSDALKAALVKPNDERGKKEKQLIQEAFYRDDEALLSLEKTAKELKKTEPASPYLNIRVVTQRVKDPRQTHILERGEFTKPLDAVSPGVLSVLPPIRSRRADADPDRLDFARWLVSGENPLTPRVIVNHVWANLFGQGLVATRNDFGVRGELPSHPALLDHLALTFVERGWSRKELIRYIVSSGTYRQSSRHRPELQERDPKNRWLARQNRFRVEAEIVRDLYLDAAELLSRKVGGPSVFPPTSKDVVALTYNSSVRWNVSPGEDRYRRGLYTFFKRTAPHPNLMTFDCPDSNTTCIERNRSNTPLAALATLNNEVFVEAARGLARRVRGLPAEHDRDRLRAAMLIATIREAEESELDALEALLEEAKEYYSEHRDDAAKLAGVSDGSANDVRELAAWTACVRVILNLDEVITRS